MNTGKGVDIVGGFLEDVQLDLKPLAWPRWRERVPGEGQGSGLRGWLSCLAMALCIVNRANSKGPRVLMGYVDIVLSQVMCGCIFQ